LVRLALRNCRNKTGFHECPRCKSRSVWKTDPQSALEETLHLILRVSPYRCARCDMRFMDAKLHADIVPTRFSRWLDSARSVASRAMIFSRKSPFQDELKLKLTSFSVPPAATHSQKHRETPMAEAVEHMTSAS
jgi:predicted Zn-ribbon and HTH transcriptional regulator